jgi:hypothetical protein
MGRTQGHRVGQPEVDGHKVQQVRGTDQPQLQGLCSPLQLRDQSRSRLFAPGQGTGGECRTSRLPTYLLPLTGDKAPIEAV